MKKQNQATENYLATLNQRLDIQADLRADTAVIRPQANIDNVIELFARLGATYGRLWSKQHDDDDDLTMALTVWAEQLYGLNKRQVERGISLLPELYPPNSKEFRSLCKSQSFNMIVRERARHLALPAPPSDPLVRERALKKIKRMQRQSGARSCLPA